VTRRAGHQLTWARPSAAPRAAGNDARPLFRAQEGASPRFEFKSACRLPTAHGVFEMRVYMDPSGKEAVTMVAKPELALPPRRAKGPDAPPGASERHD
jgi:hypothetical protein